MPETTAPQRRVVTIDAAAAYLSLSPRTIRRFVARGDLKAYRVGGKAIRVDVRDLDRLLDASRVPTGGAEPFERSA